jgi:hypothetical protein
MNSEIRISRVWVCRSRTSAQYEGRRGGADRSFVDATIENSSSNVNILQDSRTVPVAVQQLVPFHHQIGYSYAHVDHLSPGQRTDGGEDTSTVTITGVYIGKRILPRTGTSTWWNSTCGMMRIDTSPNLGIDSSEVCWEDDLNGLAKNRRPFSTSDASTVRLALGLCI